MTLPFSLSVSFSLRLYLFFRLGMPPSLSLSVFLSSLGTTLAKQVLLSLPLGVDYLDKDLFLAECSTRDEMPDFIRLGTFPYDVRWPIPDTILIRAWNRCNILVSKKMFNYMRLNYI